jgi:hypothetical protein
VNKVNEDFIPQIDIYSYFLATGITEGRMDIFADEGQGRTGQQIYAHKNEIGSYWRYRVSCGRIRSTKSRK